MIVTRTSPPQLEAALEVWRAALGGTGRRPSSAVAEQTREQLEQSLVVQCDDGVVSGVAGIAFGRPAGPDDPSLLEVLGVYVLPGRWRTGVGSALLEGLADEAWGLGYRRITAGTEDPAASALLEACGMEPGPQGFSGDLEPPVRNVSVFSEGIRLGQFLKLAGLVDTGSEAKTLLTEGGVQVNGEREERRGRQLLDGDLVTARDSAVRVHLPR